MNVKTQYSFRNINQQVINPDNLEFEDGTIYKGDVLNGQKQGSGKLIFPNGDEFIGKFDDDEINGWGVFKKSEGGSYEGEWSDNL